MSEIISEQEKRVKERRFAEALQNLADDDRALAPEEMAELFEDDGYLGSEIRALLLRDH